MASAELVRLSKRKENRKAIDKAFENSSKAYLTHYSSESFYDNDSGNSRRVTSLNSAQTRSWSIHRIIYRVFLHWALSGDLDLFYQNVRWTGWREEISSMNYDSVYSFYPFLWTEPQLSIDQRSRKTGLLINTGQFSLNLQHQLTNM